MLMSLVFFFKNHGWQHYYYYQKHKFIISQTNDVFSNFHHMRMTKQKKKKKTEQASTFLQKSILSIDCHRPSPVISLTAAVYEVDDGLCAEWPSELLHGGWEDDQVLVQVLIVLGEAQRGVVSGLEGQLVTSLWNRTDFQLRANRPDYFLLLYYKTLQHIWSEPWVINKCRYDQYICIIVMKRMQATKVTTHFPPNFTPVSF